MTEIQPIPIAKPRFPTLLGASSEQARLERARGHIRLAFIKAGGETKPSEFYQAGCAKIRTPRVSANGPREAVLVNTAGGVTGGDHLTYELSAGASSHAVVTTQGAERIYRRSAGLSRIETDIRVDNGARLDWLPQETILFDNSALSRTLCADVAPDATLLATESIILGRAAMGEKAQNVFVSDSWRVRRAGKLIFADGLRLDGNADAIMAGSATGSGATALATVLLVSPDAEQHIDVAREALDGCQGEAGASAFNGMLVARLAAPGGQALRSDLMTLIERLRGLAMPRVWHC